MDEGNSDAKKHKLSERPIVKFSYSTLIFLAITKFKNYILTHCGKKMNSLSIKSILNFRVYMFYTKVFILIQFNISYVSYMRKYEIKA